MTVEDRVRTATRARADLVTDIRPLELPADRPHRVPFAPPTRRWVGWLAPIAAAAVVIALAVTLVSTRHSAGPPTVPATSPTVSPAIAAIEKTVPEYYAEITGPNAVTVGDDRTGAVVATVSPPGNVTFVGMTAAADDRTFVLDTQADGDGTHAWYLLRVNPGASNPTQLTPLPIATLPGADQIDGLALSPDASELAVFFQPYGSFSTEGAQKVLSGGPHGPFTLRTYSLATGQALRTWTTPASRSEALSSSSSATIDNEVNLTWTADGRTLGFLFSPFTTPTYERTLNVTGPGADLIADSRPVLALTDTAPECDGWSVLTSDGKTTICGINSYAPGGGCTAPKAEFALYPVSTGKLAGFLYRDQGLCATAQTWVIWARSAASAIGVIAVYGKGNTPTVTVGVLTPGKFTPLNVQRNNYLGPEPGAIAF
jgi:hypothetical protein